MRNCILISEDDIHQRELCHTALKDLGFAFVDAWSVDEALDLCTHVTPDIIVMDIQPDEDTSDALNRFFHRERRIPIILLGDLPKSAPKPEVPFADCIAKSDDVDRLSDAVWRVLYTRRLATN